MSTKTKIVILTIVTLTFIVLFRTRGLRLHIGSNEHKAEQSTFFSGQLINVTGQLLFTPNGETLETRKREIAQTKSLDFRVYSFSFQEILELFQGMARIGIKIRGIVENKTFGGDQKAFAKLQKMFMGTRSAQIVSDEKLRDNFMHAKTFLTDSGFIIQTANLGYPSFFSNREYFFFSVNPIIHQNLKTIFAKDRAGETIKASDIHPNLLVCPFDCRAKIEILISGAQHSIRMHQQYIQDESIMNMLMQRSGLDLKFIVADNSSKDILMASPLSQFTHFRKKPYMHAKMILVDNMYLIVSSINMSANSMDQNREIGIIVIDRNLIQQYVDQFERDWVR